MGKNSFFHKIAFLVFIIGSMTTHAHAADQSNSDQTDAAVLTEQKEDNDATNLSKKTQNPVSDLISVPFQNNFGFKAGPNDDQFSYLLNIQPVIPVKLTDDWNLINRAILPILVQPTGNGESQAGVGDFNYTGFFAPSHAKEFIFGVGPSVSLPIASAEILGSGKWALGPSIVALYAHGPWVVGVLANNLWSFTGDAGRSDTANLLIQPFINYNFEYGWALSTAPNITADWYGPFSQRWTVPLGAGVTKTFTGKVPMNIVLQFYDNVVRPDTAPDTFIRLTIAFLFPTNK